MSLEEAFLRDLAEHPDDDAPRLAYADWLMEQPEELRRARGEFIAAQCGQARAAEGNPDRAHHRRRQRALLKRHRADWLEEAAPFITCDEFRRGFLDRVTLWLSNRTSGESLRIARDLFRREPAVRHLTLLPWPGPDDVPPEVVHELLESPEFPRLTSLVLRGTGLGPTFVPVLTRWPGLAGVRRLFLGVNRLDETGLMTLIGSPALSAVEALDLSWTGLATASLARLARTEHLARALYLDLSGNRLSPDNIADFMNAPGLPALRSLRLANLNLTAEHVRALLGGPRAARLRTLDLSNNAVDDAVVEPLLTLPTLEGLKLVGAMVTMGMHGRLRARFRSGYQW